jgi:ABC-type transporter Mla maintaining outer membrane lipid asymmetry ATPase subunit MlaF
MLAVAMPNGERIVQLRSVRKDFSGLRPLRIEWLDIHQGQSMALLGFDQVTAEVLVNLITGAMLPDNGDVRVLGQRTDEIPDSGAWLRTLDQFGLVSERAALLDHFTVEQNLAVPLSLQLDNLPASVRTSVREVAQEAGLGDESLCQPVAALSPSARLRVHLGRALALAPRVLLAEHPNASLPADEVAPFAADLRRIVARRGIASVVITADHEFARLVADEVLTLQPATGELRPNGPWWRWLFA